MAKAYFEEEESTQSIEHLVGHRIPWLFVGLLGGIAATVIVSKFEAILAADVRLAFFIPLIVYLSDAVGQQTEVIYIRALSRKRPLVSLYLIRESLIGLSLGVIFGALLGLFAGWWLKSLAIGLVLGLTTLINLSFAPILAVLIPSLIYRRHTDPALGSGPLATILQDLISLLVYFAVAAALIL